MVIDHELQARVPIGRKLLWAITLPSCLNACQLEHSQSYQPKAAIHPWGPQTSQWMVQNHGFDYEEYMAKPK